MLPALRALPPVVFPLLMLSGFLATSIPGLAQPADAKASAGIPPVSGQPQPLANLRFIEVSPGTGTAVSPGKQLSVNYTGWLADGTKFDSSYDRNEPIQFVQGRKQVIIGWDIGFEGMKVGGKRRLFIPYQLAYGEQGSGPIPPKAELIFDVELVDVTDVPAVPAAVDVLLPYTELESRVTALAKAVPEDKYSWRPAPEAPTFAGLFVQMGFLSRVLLKVANGEDPEIIAKDLKAGPKFQQRTWTKDEVLRLLDESFSAVRKTLETARAGGLTRDMPLFGKPTTRRGVFSELNTLIGIQLGQALEYARANSIPLPASASPIE
jgi:FKBP-type peptidyl-prolyl cis-trans isomerase